jgi:hypothetical protein
MSLPHLCPNCASELPPRLVACPQCGARTLAPVGYEWKSRLTWMGAPVLHVAFGCDATGRAHLARGVIAIGQRAVGGVAIGIMATGFVAIGLVGVGAFSFGVVAVGAVAACGVNAFGFIAIGVVAAGWKVGGLAAFGEKILFSRMH